MESVQTLFTADLHKSHIEIITCGYHLATPHPRIPLTWPRQRNHPCMVLICGTPLLFITNSRQPKSHSLLVPCECSLCCAPTWPLTEEYISIPQGDKVPLSSCGCGPTLAILWDLINSGGIKGRHFSENEVKGQRWSCYGYRPWRTRLVKSMKHLSSKKLQWV